MIVRLPFRLFFAQAITVYPWIFLSKEVFGLAETRLILMHEDVHIDQQGSWFEKAWLFGLLAWWFLYLFALPIGWNPWRRRWEVEAHKTAGFTRTEIDQLLRGIPYWLWW